MDSEQVIIALLIGLLVALWRVGTKIEHVTIALEGIYRRLRLRQMDAGEKGDETYHGTLYPSDEELRTERRLQEQRDQRNKKPS